MALRIGVDDTDSRRGMCTTFLATELVRELSRRYDLIGYPRLVRLNPNVPWKTRGNGAVCVRIGAGKGTPWRVGKLNGRDILAYPQSDSELDPHSVEPVVSRLVERWSAFDDPTTNPGFAILTRPPPQKLYWDAVRGFVTKDEALAYGRGLGIVRGYKNGRGVIGALAASAWRPRDHTYEVIAYRHPGRWGSRRAIDSLSVIEMDRKFSSTFNNYDYENERVVIAPHSPCPVLWGIRGDIPGDLPAALGTIRGEPPERWLIFETNHGTDDHVRRRGQIVPGTTVRFRGIVQGVPRNLPGGYVVVRVGVTDVTAYEPSKQFRRVVRQLIPGDRVTIVGSVRSRPRTINVEKLAVEAVAPKVVCLANPLCSSCRRRTKSAGRSSYRCPQCHAEFPKSSAAFATLPRALLPGWYEPPVGSRRHLSMPLKRLTRLASVRVWSLRSDAIGPNMDPESGNPISALDVFDHLRHGHGNQEIEPGHNRK